MYVSIINNKVVILAFYDFVIVERKIIIENNAFFQVFFTVMTLIERIFWYYFVGVCTRDWSDLIGRLPLNTVTEEKSKKEESCYNLL